MGQNEVYKALVDLRKINDSWYSSAKVIAFMKDNKLLNSNGINGVYSDLLKLAVRKEIEVRGIGLIKHHKEYRAKE